MITEQQKKRGPDSLLDKKFSMKGFTTEVKKAIEGLGKVRTDSKKVTLKIKYLEPSLPRKI